MRQDGEIEERGFHVEGAVLPHGMWTHREVEKRMIEAVSFLNRMPDRERGWLRASISSLWRMAVLSEREAREVYAIDSDDYHRDALPRRSSLRTPEVARMEEALGWIGYVPEGASRTVLGVVLEMRVDRAHDGERFYWHDAVDLMPSDGWTAEGLRKRYSGGLTMITRALNRRNLRCEPSRVKIV